MTSERDPVPFEPPAELEPAEAEGLIGAYSRGELRAAPLERFENFLFENPHFMARIEEFEAVKAALNTSGSVAVPSPPRFVTPVALAASLALACSVALNAWLLYSSRMLAQDSVGRAIVGEVRFDVRSTRALRYPLPEDRNGALALVVSVGEEPLANYRAELRGPDDVRTAFGPITTPDDAINLLLAAPRLGDYTLIVQQQRSSDGAWMPFRELRFSLVPAPSLPSLPSVRRSPASP
ncbi:MAG: hypothetical protein AAF648_06960 [Pseudomonadota bacterium]